MMDGDVTGNNAIGPVGKNLKVFNTMTRLNVNNLCHAVLFG
jgi:hypothetical protein